ncbi:MAG: hypothetical protein ACRDL4_09460 [Thermoleophilaceae bacterium]
MAHYTPEFFEDGDGNEPVLDWLRELPGYKRRAATAALQHILAHQGSGVCRSGWGKWVAAGIFELRVRQDYGTILRNAGIPIPKQEQEEAKQRHPDILLRIFCHPHGNKLVLLLAGYDKGKNPNARRQNQEIKLAEKRLKQWRARRAAAAKKAKRAGGSRKRKS